MVETHSEYLIRKLQLLVAKEEVSGEDVSILYVNSPEDVREENEFVRSITICKDGYLEGDFGPGFYDEAIKLSRQLI
jgi:predicted ATPase